MTQQAIIPGADHERLAGHEVRAIRRHWLLCSIRELARICRVSPGTVYRWERDGVTGSNYVLLRMLAQYPWLLNRLGGRHMVGVSAGEAEAVNV